MTRRFYEIDLLRGIAIMLMIFYHALYDLNHFAGFSLDISSGVFWFTGRLAAFIFIFLVGVSLTISFSRAGKKLETIDLYKKYLFRGLKIFSWGLLITVITYLFLPSGTIYFGILHFIGISIMLAYPFLRLRRLNVLFVPFIISVGVYLKGVAFSFSYLLFLGLRPEHFYTLDYYPLFPWFSVILLGILAGNTLYRDGSRRFPIIDLSRQLEPVCMLGRKSLLIYLLHQPVLVCILWIIA